MNGISMRKEEARWRAERDLDTLLEAEKVEKDPKRLAAAKKLAQERMMAVAGIASEGKDKS